jgi:glutamate 5-kinase
VHRNTEYIKRITIKIGTNLLSKETGINIDFLKNITAQIYALQKMGFQVLLVSSGAIGLGAGELGITERVKAIPMRQACASIGQPILMQHYRELFQGMKIIISQILLTREVLNNRMSFINLKNAVETLLELGTVPIFNENDSVSTAEIGTAFGDNDTLSALIASKTDSDLLVILTDIDGLYDKDPVKEKGAVLIPYIEEINDEVKSWAGTVSGSTFSTGGMKTKLTAAEIAASAGCASIIADGREENILVRLLEGEQLGTYFAPKDKIPQRIRWIMHTQPSGTLIIDEGAVEALRNKKSLLPVGVKRVEGVFERGTVVMINSVAKAVTSCNSEEIRRIIGHHTSDVRDKIGSTRRALIARPEDIVFL